MKQENFQFLVTINKGVYRVENLSERRRVFFASQSIEIYMYLCVCMYMYINKHTQTYI